MNQEHILAELRTILANKQEYTTWTVSTPHLVALVNKFVQDEREECIKLVHEGTGEPVQTKTLVILQKERKRIADAIQARRTT